MQAKGKLLDLGLFTVALVGPLLYLVGFLTRGLAVLHADLPRVALILGLLALSAGMAGYLALRRGGASLRLAAAIILATNLGGVAYSGMRWLEDLSRARAEALLEPIPLDRVGIVLAPLDQTPAAANEVRAIEESIRNILDRNGIGARVEVRRTYPILSAQQAQRIGLTLGANIVVWHTVEGGRALRSVRHVTVLGAHEMEARLDEMDLLRLMATQEDVSVASLYGATEEGMRHATEVIAPVAAGFGALGVGHPVLAATQFRNALQSEGLPDGTVAVLHAYRAMALLHADRADLAIPEFERSQTVAPSAYAWAGLGNAYLMLRDWESARTAYQQSVGHDAYYALPYCGLGLILARERDVRGAISAYRQAVALAPDWGAPHAFLGLAYELRGDATSAHDEYLYCVAKAGPNGALQEAAAQRSQQVVQNPPTPIPTATPRPTPTATPFPSSGVYQVQRGDTLAAIAGRFDVTVEMLIEVNRLENPNALSIGQILIIPELP